MKFRIDSFKGTIPKLQSDKLPDEYGSVCVNADLDSIGISGVPALTEVAGLSTSGPYVSIYEYEKKDGEFHWNAWINEVKVARSPLANDPYYRVYYSGMPGLGGTHPYATSETMLRAFANDLEDGGTGTHDQTEDWYSVGVPAPTGFNVTLDTAGSSGIGVTRAYTATFVSAYGEEGPPATPDSITLTNDDDEIDVDWDSLTTDGLTAANYYNITKVRVYMSATNSTGLTDYYFVKEHTLTGESDTGTTCTGITGELSQLGEVLTTMTYEPPPANLDGLVQLPNGWIAGFVGNRVYVCEPYLPYAWPEGNTRDLPYNIIGLGVIGQTIVAVTEGYPYLIYGASPNQLRDQQLAQFFPGTSGGSIFSAENMVFYAGTDGIITVTQSGAANITERFLKKPEYDEFSPESMVGAFYDGHYYAFTTLNEDGDAGFAIDLAANTFKTFDEPRTAVTITTSDAKMYVASEGSGGSNQGIWEWRGETLDFLQWTWKSKKFVLPKLANFCVARVILDMEFIASLQEQADDNTAVIAANAAILTAEGVELNNPPTNEVTLGAKNSHLNNAYQINGDTLTDLSSAVANLNLTFNLYADRVLVFTRVVSESLAFKLPAGYKAREYEIEMISKVPVRSVEIATTMKEMAR